jgi:nitrite reductase (NO-forming)
VIDPSALRRRARPIDRSKDRIVAMAAIGIAIVFLAAAALVTFLPPAARHGNWLSLHLALAGGATVAIAGMMPFFSAAFAAAPPSDARLRMAAVLGCATGAIGVSIGVIAGEGLVASGGGLLFVVGLILTAAATVRPLSHALGPSRGIIVYGYVAALAQVAIGASLATLFEAGYSPIVTAWAAVKPAHAWLNLIGFVSLVIATTLLHFFPTIIGARISTRPSARWTIRGLGIGTPLVAAGLVIGSDPIAWAGAALVETGAIALAAYTWAAWGTRGRWTTDPDWHRFATIAMVSAIAWFELGIAIAVGRLVAFGAAPASWSLDAVIGPIVAGWVGLAVLASATHLVPAVGPGDPAAHARQRGILGRLSIVRLVTANAGTAALAIGLPLGIDGLVAAGALLVTGTLVVTAGLIIAAISRGAAAP